MTLIIDGIEATEPCSDRQVKLSDVNVTAEIFPSLCFQPPSSTFLSMSATKKLNLRFALIQ
jgi:hypothetical protein